MAHIEFLDETMRDGQQSLWGMRMQAGMALPVAPLIDRSGFRVIDLAGSSLFEVMIRTCRENPWEGLDLHVAAMPRTRLRGGMRRVCTASWKRAHTARPCERMSIDPNTESATSSRSFLPPKREDAGSSGVATRTWWPRLCSM